LATTTAQVNGPPWPTFLASTSVRILDASGVERLAELLYVSPTQINFLIPQGTAYGLAIFNVKGAQALPDGARPTLVQPVAPALFTLNGTGQGPPAAVGLRVRADGSQAPVSFAQCSATGACILTPIDLKDGKVYLSLYGTGFRQATAAGCYFLPVSGTFNGSAAVDEMYVGPQQTFPGLDQLNLLLPGNMPSGT
jgi:uncharacterized protein (TIGR03437 family)